MSTLRRPFAALTILPLLAACELDMTGIGDALCGTYCASTPSVFVTGALRIGDYNALPDEAWLLIYARSDTLTPVDSVGVDLGYRVHFAPPPPAVCGYLARAVLWSGERTGLQPLFKPPAGHCELAPEGLPGADFEFPTYPALPEPFVVTGSVWIDGAPASAGAAAVFLREVRWPGINVRTERLPVDDQGTYRFETTDRAQWFAFCRGAAVQVEGPHRSGGTRLEEVSIGSVSPTSCMGGRRLPDVRIGSRKAARGHVVAVNSANGAERRVGAGVARLALLNPADSTVVGEEFETLDDGSFRVWFPQELAAPGCSWLLRARMEGWGVEIRPLLLPMYACSEDVYHRFVFVE